MKTSALLLLATLNAQADEPVVMNNGMVCMNNSATQQLYNCHGGLYRSEGFTDVRSGQYYPPVNREFALNPSTGLPIYLFEEEDK